MGLELDDAAHTVARGGVTVRLAPREHALLSELLDHPGETVTRERIAARVWGGEIASNTITVHVLWLREKLAALPPPPVRITAVPGAGYRLDAGEAGR
jgi:DNA-binding response OmpR family regulator